MLFSWQLVLTGGEKTLEKTQIPEHHNRQLETMSKHYFLWTRVTLTQMYQPYA